MSEDNSPLAGVKVPFPDAAYATRTANRLTEAQIRGSGLGSLTAAVSWAGRVQNTNAPVPFTQPQGLIVTGSHRGGYAAGDADETESLLDGSAPLTRLAERAQLPLRFIHTTLAPAAEDGPLLSEQEYVEALEIGKQAADDAIDSGADLLVVAGLGPGTVTAAIAVTSHLVRVPAVDLSPRLRVPGGLIDDNTWMRRTAAIRDTVVRTTGAERTAATTLREFGGPVLATLTAIIVAAAVRRTPLLIDGPVATAAALTSRDFSLGAPKWCYAPDRIPHPVVDKVANQVGMAAPIGFGIDIGEGCAVMNALPLVQDALRLANSLPFAPEEPGEEPAEEAAAPDDTQPEPAQEATEQPDTDLPVTGPAVDEESA